MHKILMLALLIPGCAIVSMDLSEDWEVAFNQISMEWSANEYTCQEMSQVYRDYLHSQGIPYDHMRLVGGGNIALPTQLHMWLEVFQDGKWWIYDPLARNFHILEDDDIIYSCYTVNRRIYGGHVRIRGGGYENYGDRFINGEWIRNV